MCLCYSYTGYREWNDSNGVGRRGKFIYSNEGRGSFYRIST
jgi:hypothetical protein